MTFRNLFAFAAAAILFAGCSSKPKPVDLNGQSMYLTSASLHKSPYLELTVNFHGSHQAELFKVKSLHPMYGDVTMGDYAFDGNSLTLPELGTFAVKPTAKGYNLFRNNMLVYLLTKGE